MNAFGARRWFEPSVIAKAVVATASRRRRWVALEQIEPRLLLSDTPFTASQAAALTAGLQGLSSWADTLDNAGALAQALPVYTLAAPLNPDSLRTYATLGAKVDLGAQLGNLLATPLKNYFAGDTNPTLSELVVALDAVPGVTVSGTVNGSEAALTVLLDVSIAPTAGTIDLLSAANGIRAKTTLDLGAHLVFAFDFGLDLSPGLSGPEAFFIRVANNALVLSADAHKSNIAVFSGRVGFLDASFGGSAASKIDVAASVSVAFTNGEVNADGKITLSELLGTELSNLVTQTSSATLGVNLPVSATLGTTFNPSAVMAMNDGNLFDATASAVSLTGSGAADMLKFNTVTNAQMLALANELGAALNSLQTQDVLKFDVPFVKGESLSALDDFGSKFAAKLTADSALNGLQPVHAANPDGSGEVLPNTPSFASAQELAQKLAQALGLADANAGVAYNTTTSELTYHIKLATSASESATLTLDAADTGALRGVATSTAATLTETSSLDFTFGINLSPLSGATDSLERHFFIKDAALEANVALASAAAMAATGRFGLVDFTANPSASGTSKVTRSLKDPITSASQITLEKFFTGLGTPSQLTTAAVLSGASHLDLAGIAVPASEVGIVGPLGVNPTITLSKTAPDAVTTLTTSPSAAALAKFANLKVADIVAALHEADDYLTKIATLGALGKAIPGLGVGAGELLHLADALDGAIAKFQADPPISLASVASKLSAALTAAGKTAVSVSFVADPVDPSALMLSLQFGSATSSKAPLRLDLSSLAALAGSGTHAADDQVTLVDVSAVADRMDVDTAATFHLDLGISLADAANPKPFLYDTSSAVLTLHVDEAGLALQLAAGPLQVAVAGGSVLIDKDGPGATNDPASFVIDVLDPGAVPNARITTDELMLLDAAHVGVAVTGQVHVTLPTTFGSPSQSGTLALAIANLGNELGGAANSVTLLTIPDFSSQLSASTVSNNLGVVADGLDALLKTLQGALNSEVFGKNMPLVGDQLAGLSTGVIEHFRKDFVDKLKTELGPNPDAAKVKDALFKVLHDQLGVLGDTDGNAVIDTADVQLAVIGGLPKFKFLLVEPIFTVSTGLGFNLGLPGLGLSSDAKVKADLSFKWLVDFGISVSDGFFLDTTAANELSLTLGLSIPNANATGDLGFLHLAVDDKGSNLTGTIAVDLKDADNRLTLGEIAAGPVFAGLVTPVMDIKSKVDLNLNVSFAGSPMFPSFNTEFLMQWDFNAASPEAALAGPSVLQFKDVSLLLGSFVSDFLKPIVDTIKKTFDPIKPILDFITEPIPVLSDIPLLPELLGDPLTPDPATGIEVIEIASRVLGFFGVPKEIFDAIAVIDKVNDIANLLSAPNPMNQLAIILGTFDIAGALSSQGGDARQAGGLANLTIDVAFDPLTQVKGFVDSQLPADSVLRKATDKLFESAERKLGSLGLGPVPNGNDLRFPVLDNPETLFGLLLGRDVNLFELELAPFKLETGTVNQSVSLFGPLSAGFFGTLTIAGDFAFGYDTRGLVEVADQLLGPKGDGKLHPELLLDGFFISDTGTVSGKDQAGNKLPDIPELTFSGAIGAKAEYTAVVVAVGVQGGVFADLNVNLHDLDGDGKIRGKSEIFDVLAGNDPLCLFDTSGDVHAGINAYVKVGFDTPLGFVTLFEDSFDIANKVIFNLDHECDVTPVLAKLNAAGLLTLNMGPNAGARMFGGDDAEVFSVTQVADGVVDVRAFGLTQRYGDKGVKVTGIFADGGNFDDMITLDPSVTIGSTLIGGSGNDQIQGGSGIDNIDGGLGDDVLLGGKGNDVIRGQENNDLIFGNEGADRLDGGSGDDRVYGGNGADFVDNTGDEADVIFGGTGNDNLYGNLGNDILWGGAGFDQLYGGDGDDLLAGGEHDDLIEGGLGADKLYGDADLDPATLAVQDDKYAGNDALFGDARNPNHPGKTDGNDQLFGSGGDDLLSGGLGNDDLFGGDGNDRIFGDARIAVGPETVLASGQTDDDYAEGGKGNDAMYGGAGADRMIGGTSSSDAGKQDATGADLIVGDSGNDTLLGDNARFGSIILIGGTGNDTLLGGAGDDLIYGQGGDDTAEGGTGNDTIYGNAGNDTLRGQEDNDSIEGGSGGDTILGGSGDDNLIGGVSKIADLEGVDDIADLIFGDSGNDVILGDNGTISGAARDVVTNPNGGAGDDSLYGGADNDVIFGEGGSDRIVGDVAGATGLDILVGDQGTSSGTLVVAQHSSFAGSGGADIISGSGGDDIILGGDAGDTLAGDAGNDIIVGDDGQVTLLAGVVVKVETLASGFGGVDQITGGNDADIALGGEAGDVIDGGADAASDVLLGDNGLVDFLYNGNADPTTLDLIRSYANGSGAADTISGGGGGDVVVGGTGGDTIYGDNAAASSGASDTADILIGDNADIVLQGHAGQLLVRVAGRTVGTAVARITTTDSTVETSGGADTISGNAGGDVILGGVNNGGVDTLYGDAASPVNALDGADIILGDNGTLDFAYNGDTNLGTLDLIRSSLDKAGGVDTISGNAGSDVVIGGSAGDTIYGDNASASAGAADGSDILLGDNADIVLVDPATHAGISGDAIGILGGGVAKIATTDIDTLTGGSDTIVGNAGGDIIMGGVLAETIYGDAATPGAFDGNDVILGDNGRLEWLYTGDPAFASIESGMPGAFDNSLATLDLITTDVPASHPGGRDTIYGDAGNDVAFGGEYADTLFGDTGTLADSGGGNDILFGDHGRLYPHRSLLTTFASRNFFATDTGNGSAAEGDRIWGESGDDVILGEQGDDRLFGGSGNDDIIGGSNVAGAVDELAVTNIAATQAGAAINDLIDGGSGDDTIAGDNATIWRRTSIASARFQVLSGTAIYSSTDSTDTVNVTGTPQNYPNGVVGRDITLLDHSDTTPVGLYGNDVIAGGAGNDLVFGELGNDVIQGDGSLGTAAIAGVVSLRLDVADTGPAPKTDGTLFFNVPEAATDGDDYIEGNGGSDLLYGGLGQDDIIGGSSGLFGLTSRDQRPDVGDVIYGGAATPSQLARNSSGTPGLDSHARDADVIVGDNGNIYRLVGAGKYLTFNYDVSATGDLRGSLRIVPRAIQLLDYTLGGPDFNAVQAALDRGGNDLIHGEGGDDIAYGMKGDDVLYGEGQNDDLVGGYGNDWISGGTGDDGAIGDDGRIRTSRNGLAEPLYGVNSATVQQTISTPGNIQLATINVTGTLTKAVDLTPFSNDPAWSAAVDEFGGITRRNADDIIFGGLGNDFLHGGSGDDAISGAEALVLSWAPVYDPVTHVQTGVIEVDYTHPVNLGYMLAFNPVDVDGKHANLTRAGEFALYNEYDPLRKIVVNGGEFFLNFDANDPAAPASTLDPSKKTDGDDKIFGDLGNDWLVGGTGRDDMYGGFGNDLLNADDDLGTNSGANDQPDTSASYEDRAFGGAGRDVLIANTGGDRLIDWTGEFNSYLVPFAPFGMATVSRTLQPHLLDFLYALSAADGADPTRAADKASLGADSTRNGEPWGELGLVLQKDAAWGDQHGGPADPQAGNIPGGQRDVLRSASFDTGNPQGFVPASGTWSVANGRYQVAPPAGGGDAISLFNQADTVIPSYFEMQATINAVKPVGGTKANAFLIFDYQSDTDFKYAGIDISSNKVLIGHRTASGWAIDSSANAQLKAGIDYVVLLKVSGGAVTVTIGTTSLSFTFAPRTDTLGIKHSINDGIVGIGGNNAAAQIDDVVVQAPPGAITLDKTVDFGSASPASGLFGTPTAGSWQTTADGRFVATAAAASAPAIDLIGIAVSPGSLLEITATLKTSSQGGVVFDYQGPALYKFATLSADSKQVLIGHSTAAGLVIDASFNTNIAAGTDYKLKVTLRGGLVNVSLNGAVVASKFFNETVTVGGYGLIGRSGASSGTTSFDSVTVKTDDAAYAPVSPLLAAAAPTLAQASTVGATAPTAEQIDALVTEAKRRWAASGLSADLLARLDTLDVQVADLAGLTLGQETGHTVTLDSNAAGYGWFIDATPGDDTEFSAGGGASGRIDLLSVLAHEMGHALGLDHSAGNVMDAALAPDQRVMPMPIAWSAVPAAADSAPRIDDTASWLHRFVNHLGASPERLHPNARLKVELPFAHRASSL